MSTRLRQGGVARAAGGVLLLLLPAAAGCGPGVGEVSGKVTYKGQALPDGTVTLLASDGRPYEGKIQADGSFTIQGVPVGPARVTVTSVAAATGKGKAAGKGEDARKGERVGRVAGPPEPEPGKEGGQGAASTGSRIPLAYGDFSKSGLTVQVERPSARLDLDLK
jgi:hypothetical protein